MKWGKGGKEKGGFSFDPLWDQRISYFSFTLLYLKIGRGGRGKASHLVVVLIFNSHQEPQWKWGLYPVSYEATTLLILESRGLIKKIYQNGVPKEQKSK